MLLLFLVAKTGRQVCTEHFRDALDLDDGRIVEYDRSLMVGLLLLVMVGMLIVVVMGWGWWR